MEWFRWYHRSTDDEKFETIARAEGVPKHMVIALWLRCLEYASDNRQRGSVVGMDLSVAAARLDIERETAERIWSQFDSKKMIQRQKIVAWHRRNPISDDSAVRQKAYRKRKLQSTDITSPSRDSNVTVTERTEQTRQEQTRQEQNMHAGGAPEAVPKPNGKSETSRPNGHSGRPSEWPQTASAICESFPATDDVAISSVVQSLVQAYCGIDHPMIELSDGLLAEAIRKAKFPDQKSALGFRKAGAELVRNWALGRGNPPRGKRVYTPPMAVEAS